MDTQISEKITYIRNRLTRIQSSIKRKEIKYAKYIENYEYNPQYYYINFEHELEIKDLYEQYNRYNRKLDRCNIRLERMN